MSEPTFYLRRLKSKRLSVVSNCKLLILIDSFPFLGLKEKIVRSFEVSPDGSFLLINGVAGYLHLLSMKVNHY